MFDPTQCESVSMAQAKAQEEQNPVNAALRATSIAFVTLAGIRSINLRRPEQSKKVILTDDKKYFYNEEFDPGSG